MKDKSFVFAGTILLLSFVAFQNCSKEQSINGQNIESTSFSQVVGTAIGNQYLLKVAGSNTPYFQLNLQSGAWSCSSSTTTGTLDANQLTQLQGLLRGATVCAYFPAPNFACDELASFGYATLSASDTPGPDDTYSLGGNIYGLQSGACTVDLCDSGQAAQLQSFVQAAPISSCPAPQ